MDSNAEGVDMPTTWVDPFDVTLESSYGLYVEPYEPKGIAQYPMIWPTPDYLAGYGDDRG